VKLSSFRDAGHPFLYYVIGSLRQFAPVLAIDSGMSGTQNHFDHGGTTPVILAYATSWPMCSLL
jgi:hypothetical protein